MNILQAKKNQLKQIIQTKLKQIIKPAKFIHCSLGKDLKKKKKTKKKTEEKIFEQAEQAPKRTFEPTSKPTLKSAHNPKLINTTKQEKQKLKEKYPN